MNTNLPSAYKVLPSTSAEINQPLYPPPQWLTTAPLLGLDSDADSNTDVQDSDVIVDSESDEGDSSILLGNDNWGQVSGQLPPFQDIILPVDMPDAGNAQGGADQPPTAPAADSVSKDGWLAPKKFTGTSVKDAQLWWSSFQL